VPAAANDSKPPVLCGAFVNEYELGFTVVTALQQLADFVRTPCAFRCIGAGQFPDTPPAERFLAHVLHRLNPPATALQLWELRSSLGPHAAEAEAVYARHNGFVLYQDPMSNAAGIEALSIRRWSEAATEVRGRLSDYFRHQDPDRILGGVAFAHVPQSGNFFVIPVDGPNAGKVFYTNHEGGYELFAGGFDGFVQRVTTEPAALMFELGSHTRYSDGKTDVQWIPKELVSGETAAARREA
jgi:hypothetical protein